MIIHTLFFANIYNNISLKNFNQVPNKTFQSPPILQDAVKKSSIWGFNQENQKSSIFGFNQENKEYYSKEEIKELKNKIQEFEIQLANMKNEIDELKQKSNDKSSNQFSTNHLKSINDKSFEINESESIINFEKVEDIKSDKGIKYSKVLIKKLCLLKEIMNQNAKSEDLQHLEKEFEIMKKLNHPNVVKAEYLIANDKNHSTSMLVEYCPNNLQQAINNKTLSKVQQVFSIYQIAEGMKYIHSRKIIHQNLNPSSIFISEQGTIKIGEFQNSLSINSENPSNEELLKEMSDVSSFGDIVYFILSGGKTTEIKNVTSLSSFSLLAKQLIDACWCVELESRPTFEIICEVLEKNDFNLISLSQQETQEVKKMIIQYKAQISQFDS